MYQKANTSKILLETRLKVLNETLIIIYNRVNDIDKYLKQFEPYLTSEIVGQFEKPTNKEIINLKSDYSFDIRTKQDLTDAIKKTEEEISFISKYLKNYEDKLTELKKEKDSERNRKKIKELENNITNIYNDINKVYNKDGFKPYQKKNLKEYQKYFKIKPTKKNIFENLPKVQDYQKMDLIKLPKFKEPKKKIKSEPQKDMIISTYTSKMAKAEQPKQTEPKKIIKPEPQKDMIISTYTSKMAKSKQPKQIIKQQPIQTLQPKPTKKNIFENLPKIQDYEKMDLIKLPKFKEPKQQLETYEYIEEPDTERDILERKMRIADAKLNKIINKARPTKKNKNKPLDMNLVNSLKKEIKDTQIKIEEIKGQGMKKYYKYIK